VTHYDSLSGLCHRFEVRMAQTKDGFSKSIMPPVHSGFMPIAFNPAFSLEFAAMNIIRT
jgi:hypothetical protein